MKMVRWLDKHLEEVLLLVMLCAMVVIMGIQITARYVFSSSLSWSEEITRYLFICSGFLSASFCVKKSASVKIDQLVQLLPGRGVHILRLVSYTIELIFFSYLIPFAWGYMMSGVKSGQLSPACGIPMYLIQSTAVISFILCVLRLIQKWIQRVQIIMGKRVGLGED
ncbi:MAG: TRAP transporter small permease [Ruminococcus sp.]|jgi:TRAP-type C4-dicarboxylate transport system permease small subunit|nr:TRAP transporter small permease [Ruminococcus sp.]